MTHISTRRLAVISDLHIGDCGPRDNFHALGRSVYIKALVDFIQIEGFTLVIAGDLLEGWQCNLGDVIERNLKTLILLGEANPFYIPGNHDNIFSRQAAGGYCWASGLDIFKHLVSRVISVQVDGLLWYICHGDTFDPYCDKSSPGLGVLAAIYAGLKEDKAGAPLDGKYRSVEHRIFRRVSLISYWIRRLTGMPSYAEQIARRIEEDIPLGHVISGHTHVPGARRNHYYNCGSWVEAHQPTIFLTGGGFETGVYEFGVDLKVRGPICSVKM